MQSLGRSEMKKRKILKKQQKAEEEIKKKSLKKKLLLGVTIIGTSIFLAFLFADKQQIKEKIAEKAVESVVDGAAVKIKDQAIEKLTEKFNIKP